MALFALTDTFVYIDLSNTTEHVDGSALIDTGFWSSAANYLPNEVVQYGDALFICLAANTGEPPTTSSRGAFWAILVKTNAPPPPPSLEEVYVVATSGSNLAYALYGSTAGTNYIPNLPGAVHAFHVDFGTQLGQVSASNVPYDGLTVAGALENLTILARSGTATADAALRVAGQGTVLAYEALQEAWYGTQAAATIAYPALVTAWVGTATANAALSSASQGTSLAITALETAWAGTDLAYNALQQAWYGTQTGGASGYPALVTAWTGTATANVALSVAGQGTNLATTALETAWAGTDLAYTALVTARTGTATANVALSVGAAGTNAAAAAIDLANQAFVLAESGTLGAYTALQTAWAGTSTANAAVMRAGDTMTGPLTVTTLSGTIFQNYQTPLSYAGTVTLDFSAATARKIDLGGDVVFITASRAANCMVKAKILCDGSGRNLTFVSGWHWVSTQPTTIAANKTAILSLEAWGTNETDVVAVYAVEA